MAASIMICEMVKSGARTGDYAVSVSGTASANAVWQYRFSKTNIEVTKPMRLTAYRAASGMGENVQIMLSMRSGQNFVSHLDAVEGSFSRLVADIPQSFVGDHIDAISIYLNTGEEGAFSAMIDDILIEEWDAEDTAIEHAESSLDFGTKRYDILGRPVTSDYKGIIVSPAGKYRMK